MTAYLRDGQRLPDERFRVCEPTGVIEEVRLLTQHTPAQPSPALSAQVSERQQRRWGAHAPARMLCGTPRYASRRTPSPRA